VGGGGFGVGGSVGGGGGVSGGFGSGGSHHNRYPRRRWCGC
jgi:hypothetical protein